MFTVRLCGLNIEIDNRYGYVESLCRNYIGTDGGAAAFRVRVSGEDICGYRAECDRRMSDAEAESALLYRAICGRMPAYDALLLHAAVVAVDGRGYAFSAARGVGKTTHLRAWQEVLGDRVTVVNGDKPLVRRAPDGHWWVYGTPWCGKEGEQTNTRCQLNAVCLLSRGQSNAISRAPLTDAAAGILEATLLLAHTAPARSHGGTCRGVSAGCSGVHNDLPPGSHGCGAGVRNAGADYVISGAFRLAGKRKHRERQV